MSTTNWMPKTTPWQAVQQIPIKSATFRQSETSLWHVHYYTTNRTNGDRAEQNSDRIGRKMSENDENLFPWQRPLRDSNQILQQSSTPVGLPAGEKNGENRSHTFWANRTWKSSKNRKQFWLSESAEVITDGAIRQKTKFPTFSLPETMCVSRVVFELRRKNEISEKESWFSWKRPLKNQKSRLRLIIYSHGGTERENRVKIRPVEAEIKWLTEIVKKEIIIRYRSKTYGYPGK